MADSLNANIPCLFHDQYSRKPVWFISMQYIRYVINSFEDRIFLKKAGGLQHSTLDFTNVMIRINDISSIIVLSLCE